MIRISLSAKSRTVELREPDILLPRNLRASSQAIELRSLHRSPPIEPSLLPYWEAILVAQSQVSIKNLQDT